MWKIELCYFCCDSCFLKIQRKLVGIIYPFTAMWTWALSQTNFARITFWTRLYIIKFSICVLINSSFAIIRHNFSLSSLTLWHCRSCLCMKWCTLSPSSSLRYPNILCLAKKRGTSKISSCIFREIFSFGKYFVKFLNSVHSDLTVFISVSVKNSFAEINLLSSE